MVSKPPLRFSALVSFLALFLFNTFAMAGDFPESFCSSQNTANSDSFNWTWQSNGKCTDYCKGKGNFAFAVIKYQDCWCSNNIPSQQNDIGDCQLDCPGFPGEHCGNKDKNLYIYIKMEGTPVSPTVSSAPLPPSNSSASKQATTKPASTPATTSIWVVTESGAVVTRTLVVSPTMAPAKTGSNNSKSSTGAIVGGVLGGILGLLAIIGGIFFVLWRRRRQRQEEHESQSDSPTGITRNTSTMSKAGLIGSSTEQVTQYLPQIVTTYAPQRHDTDPTNPERRFSQAVMIDSRLDPRAVLTFHGSNISRDSLASMDDSRDYGRQLNVRNPDPVHRA